MDTNAGGAVQGEAGFDSDDCDYLLEVGETFDHGDEEVSLYGAEGYAEGRLGRKILKGLGKAGTAIGRAIAPEFAPIYNLADRGLDKIRSGQHVDDQYVRSHFPDLASREVYDRFKHADLGSHPTVYDKNGNEVWSTISASLPELMLHAADNIEGEVEADWAMSIISPFNAGAKGSRIPNIQSTPTVTATAYTDLGAFSVAPDTQALMFTNFGALNTEPWMLINGLPNTC